MDRSIKRACFLRVKIRSSEATFLCPSSIPFGLSECFIPTEVPHELAESLAPIEKEIANEQRKPKRRMGAPG
jgi:hypothetical protein